MVAQFKFARAGEGYTRPTAPSHLFAFLFILHSSTASASNAAAIAVGSSSRSCDTQRLRPQLLIAAPRLARTAWCHSFDTQRPSDSCSASIAGVWLHVDDGSADAQHRRVRGAG